MKKLLLGIAVALAVSACQVSGPSDPSAPPASPAPSNPFVGTWAGTVFGPVSYTFKADKTFSAVIAANNPPEGSGTYTYTDTQLAMHWTGGSVVAILYTIDGKTMTWAPVSGPGMLITLTKQ